MIMEVFYQTTPDINADDAGNRFIYTTLILNTLLFPSHRYSSVPKILHLLFRV